jgi:hypothetical protein
MLARLKVGVAVALGAASVFVGPTTPALAGGSPHRFDATTGPDAESAKTATAECPPGLFVFGVGARVTGGEGGVVITAIVPDASMGSVTAAATARDWFDGVWSLTAFAVCDVAYAGVGRVSETTYGETSASATCPGHTRLTGAGFRWDGSVETRGVREVALGPGLLTARVGLGGATGPTSLTTYAICRWYSWQDGPAGAVVNNPGTLDGTWPKMTTVEDTTVDMRLYGVGATVTGPADAFLTALVPSVNHDVAVAEATRSGPWPAPGMRVADDGEDDEDDDGSLSASGLFVGVFH